jgi:hypothetical protein
MHCLLYGNAGFVKISQCARASFSQSRINANRIIFTTTAIFELANVAYAAIDRCRQDGPSTQ